MKNVATILGAVWHAILMLALFAVMMFISILITLGGREYLLAAHPGIPLTNAEEAKAFFPGITCLFIYLLFWRAKRESRRNKLRRR